MSTMAMYCDMVGSGNQSLLARVSIVNQHDSVLLDKYVKPTATVTDYRTFVSKIKKEHLDNGETFNSVRRIVSKLICRKVLVGHSLGLYLRVLGLSHPKAIRRDLAKYGPLMKGRQSQSLKFLAQKYLNKNIQDRGHDSVQDAWTAMEIYQSIPNWN